MFGDLELGKYYIKEIRPSEGYMFDEAVYDVTISYKDQMIKIEKRDEMCIRDRTGPWRNPRKRRRNIYR